PGPGGFGGEPGGFAISSSPPNNYGGGSLYPPQQNYGRPSGGAGYPPQNNYGGGGSSGYPPQNSYGGGGGGGGYPPQSSYGGGGGQFSPQQQSFGPGGGGGGGGYPLQSQQSFRPGGGYPAQNMGSSGQMRPPQNLSGSQNMGMAHSGYMGPPQGSHEGFYIGRRKHKDSVQVGMVCESKGGLVVAYDGKALLFRDGYEILCGPSSLVKWLPAHSKLEPAKLADTVHQPLVCGSEKNGEKLYAATTTLNGRDYAGKASAKSKGILFAHDGGEHKAKDYFVLCEIKAKPAH
ncbi:hypothetical protein GGF38_003516, partial [Coemansia sp. RSA 25]